MHLTTWTRHAIVWPLALACYASASLEPGQWWRKPFGMFQTNLREIDVDLDVGGVLDYLEEYGAAAWLISVGGILANYPTDLPFQSTNPYLSRRPSGDLIGDALDASHARGVRLLARMDFSKVSADIADEHPDWLYRTPEGATQNHTAGLVSVCPSAEYYQERIFDILDEVTDRYAVDGFFVNWAGFNEHDYFKVYHGVCHCDSCHRRWREYQDNSTGEEGLPLPNGPEDENYLDWKQFSDGIIEDWTARVAAFVAEKLPDAGLILGDSADIRFFEANNEVGRELWPHLTSQTVSSLAAYSPEVPVLVNAVTFVDMPYRMGSEAPAQYAQYLLQTISRGGNPSSYIMGIPGKIPYLGLDVGAELTNFHRKWKDVYDGLRPVARTGLVLPDKTQINETQYEEAESEFRGLYSAMQELHVPFDVISQKYVAEMSTSGSLDRYQVVVLPHLGELRDDDVIALDEWVAAGGHLITTGTSGVTGDGEVQLKSLPIAKQRELITDSKKLWSTYFAPTQDRTQESYYTGPIVPIYGTYSVFQWTEGAEGRYKSLDYAPFAPPEYAYGNVQGDERGSGAGTYGKGRGALIPFTVGRGYRELGLRVFRDFFETVLRENGAAREPFEFHIAEQVEITVNVNSRGQTIVHFRNISGLRKQNFGSHLPIPAGVIKVSGGNVTARALRGDSVLEVVDGEIQIPGIDLFEVIVIEGLEQQ